MRYAIVDADRQGVTGPKVCFFPSTFKRQKYFNLGTSNVILDMFIRTGIQKI